MRILLINPPNAGILKAVGVHFPLLGLLYMAAYLEREGYHPVFKHDHISFIRLQWLLLKANLLYYSRSRKGGMDFLHLIKRHKLGVGTLFLS